MKTKTLCQKLEIKDALRNMERAKLYLQSAGEPVLTSKVSAMIQDITIL